MMLLLGTRTLTLDPNRLVKADYHYNPAIFEWLGKFHLLYRYETKVNHSFRGSRLAISTLGDDFQPNGEHFLLDPPGRRGCEDPRIFECHNRLYVSYGSEYQQHLMQLDAHFQILRDQPLSLQLQQAEKNWTYHEHEGRIFCTYTWQPHVIYELDDQWMLTKRYENPQQVKWPWGQIRGGTNPVLFGDELWTFFHSCYFHPFLDIFNDRIYVAGYLVTEHQPPFRIKRYSTQPVLTPDFADIRGPTPLAVVFPARAVRIRGGWLVAYGSNDHRCKLSSLDDRELALIGKEAD